MRARSSGETGLNDPVIDAEVVQFPASLHRQLAPMIDQQDPPPLACGFVHDLGRDHRLATAGWRDEQNPAGSAGNSFAKLRYDANLIGVQLGPWPRVALSGWRSEALRRCA
jgi:hypothetical protein